MVLQVQMDEENWVLDTKLLITIYKRIIILLFKIVNIAPYTKTNRLNEMILKEFNFI